MTEDMEQYPLRLDGGDIPMVRFQNVTKRYGSLVVLDQLDLDVSAGEMVTIIGPSGSGKTTVLRMLMTLETINSGVIYVEGEPLTHMERQGRLVPANSAHIRRIRGKIGMCFQHFNLFPHMTALGNCMEGPVQVLGLSRKEAEERSLELLEMVGLADKRDQHPVPSLRWAATACRDRPGARHAAQGHAVRRGDVGAGSRGHQRGDQRDPSTWWRRTT